MSENYRYYHLSRARHFVDAAWFRAECDKEAIAEIEAKHPDARCEIWQGGRMVAKISSTQQLTSS